ncbi:MAG: alpha-E domain-containing protein [Eubacteriales bacterium]
MGIISIEHSDRLLWLGRYCERVYTTLRLFEKSYDTMIDLNKNQYVEFCANLDIPNIYQSGEDFCVRYCFDENDPNSIYSNLTRAYDNALVLREALGSEVLAYIQMAVYDMQKAKKSRAPLIELQKITDCLMAFWGMVDDAIDNRNVRNILKTGKRIERISLYGRLGTEDAAIQREVARLYNRIVQTELLYNQTHLTNLVMLAKHEDVGCTSLVVEVESLMNVG